MALQHQLDALARRSLELEIDAALRKLRQIPEIFEKEYVRETILRPAAQILQRAAQANIRNAPKVVKRYSTSKGSKKIKAPKGRGNVVATYEPGNLKLSMSVLKFRRSKSLFVGAKVMKRNPNGTFGKGRSADGWYAHFIEFGTRRAKAHPFMRPAAYSSAKAVHLRIKYGVETTMKKWMIKNATR